MGGIYYNIWSCSNCDYNERTVSGPFRVEPKEGVVKAKIEHRWCSDCNGIRRVFTAEGYEYKLGEEPNSKISRHIWRHKNIIELKNEIDKLEKIKKSKLLFSITKQAKELKELKEILPLYAKAQVECEQMTLAGKEHYDSLNLKPKCLICGGDNVSQKNWDNDIHHCGGVFRKDDSGRMGSVGQFEFIEYDKDGNPNSTMKNMR